MTKQYLLIVAFFLLGNLHLKAQVTQDTVPTYQSVKFKSLDMNVGIGWTAFTHLSIVYQQNIERGFAWIVLSQFANNLATPPSPSLESYTFFNWVETAGLGGTMGNKRFNTGLFLVGGARLYYTKLTGDPAIFHEPTLVTKKLRPELGLLYNLKVGKKKFYFTSQIYASMFPFKNFIENPHTLSIGVGYKFKGKV